MNASDWLSGDQRRFVPESRSPPRRAVVPAATSQIQICDEGLPDRLLDWTVYAMRFPSPDIRTSPTVLIIRRSAAVHGWTP
jgi:hypothetical protein